MRSSSGEKRTVNATIWKLDDSTERCDSRQVSHFRGVVLGARRVAIRLLCPGFALQPHAGAEFKDVKVILAWINAPPLGNYKRLRL